MTNAVLSGEQEKVFGYDPNDPIVAMARKLGRVFEEGESLPPGDLGINSQCKTPRGSYAAKRILRDLTWKMYGQLNSSSKRF